MRKKPIAWLLLTLILVSALYVALVGCSSRKTERAELKPNSFADAYKIDAELDLSGSYAILYYSDGYSEPVQITAEQVVGFDTSTTGEKTLTVSIKGFTLTHSYRVYNPENAAREILTSARITVGEYQAADGKYAEYTLRLGIGNAGSASAIVFTLGSAEALGIKADKSNLTIFSEGSNASFESALSSDGKRLKVVVFNKEGGTLFNGDGILASIRISDGTVHSVAVSDISLSNGNGVYYLPPAI